MTIFTLTTERVGESSILNGKLLAIKYNKENALFIDVVEKKVIWTTTKVLSLVRVKDSLIIKTSSGSVYEFINVSSLIPTKPTEKPEEQIILLNKRFENKHINYGDGYDKTTFTFNRGITEDEFRQFLKSNGYKLKEKAEWWVDYSTIEGKGNTWTYKWVRVYTD